MSMDPKVGMKYTFTPSGCDDQKMIDFAGKKISTEIEGVIIAVNPAHRCFTVQGKHKFSGAVFTTMIKY